MSSSEEQAVQLVNDIKLGADATEKVSGGAVPESYVNSPLRRRRSSIPPPPITAPTGQSAEGAAGARGQEGCHPHPHLPP